MTLPARLRRTDRTHLAVAAIVVLALLARLAFLGDRVHHFDEARVAWWTLEFLRTGSFEYRYIIHGPFVQHVNAWLFSLVGPSDFSSRLVVALVGGLLPLAALLFRDHLRDAETVAVAGFLAFNPVLLYYSRFFRSTVLVAGFMFVSFGFLVRLYDTREARYAYLAVAFAALGFTAKENAVVYLLCWLGAGTLVVAFSWYVRPDGRAGAARVRDVVAGIERPDDRALARGVGHLVLAAALFAAVVVYFYAPRGGTAGIERALGAPGRLPGVLGATVDAIASGYEYWFGHASEPGCREETLVDGYACFLRQSLEVLAGYAAPLVGLALVGAAVEHARAERPRGLVLLASYWGFVSVFGYPLGTDVFGAWIMVNALVPLAIPAGVGLALVYRVGVESYRDDDRVSVALVAVLLLLVAGQMAHAGVTSSYLRPTADDNALVQYAQPSQDWRGTLADVDRIARDNEGTDVLVYGEFFVDGATEAERTPACVKWFQALPLPWYLAMADARVSCATTPADLDAASGPPVVVARADERDVLAERLGDGYEARTHHLRTVGVETVVFVRR